MAFSENGSVVNAEAAGSCGKHLGWSHFFESTFTISTY
jgi:hypothetical protein